MKESDLLVSAPTSLAVETPGEIGTCADCRIHAARIGPEKADVYQPPLGPKIRIRCKSGGYLDVCPRCTLIPWAEGEPKKSLVEVVQPWNRRTVREFTRKARILV